MRNFCGVGWVKKVRIRPATPKYWSCDPYYTCDPQIRPATPRILPATPRNWSGDPHNWSGDPQKLERRPPKSSHFGNKWPHPYPSGRIKKK